MRDVAYAERKIAIENEINASGQGERQMPNQPQPDRNLHHPGR